MDRRKRSTENSASAIGYVRVSSEEQVREGVSLAAQEERIRAYCVVRGLELVEVVRDEGLSAGKPLASRAGGSRVLEAVATGRAGHVVVVKLDRAFRNAADALNVTADWDRRGVSLQVIDMGGNSLDTASAMGRMFLTMAAGFAELERNLIRERTAAAMRHKKSKGERVGTVPLGWRAAEDGKLLVAVPEEQAVLARVRALAGGGPSLREVARRLTAEGVPTKRGGRWHAKTIAYALRHGVRAEAS